MAANRSANPIPVAIPKKKVLVIYRPGEDDLTEIAPRAVPNSPKAIPVMNPPLRPHRGNTHGVTVKLTKEEPTKKVPSGIDVIASVN